MNRPLFQRQQSDHLWEQTRTPKTSSAVSRDEATKIRSMLPPPCLNGFCSNLFASEDGKGMAYWKEDIISSHAEFERSYMERIGSCASGMRRGHRISPSPITLPRAKLQEMANIQSAISAGLAGVLRAWGRPNSWLQKAMPLSPKAEAILLRCDEFVNGLLNVERPIGSFRPDILIAEDGRLQVCEINARFALNGFLVTLGCVEALHTTPSSSPLGSLALGVVPSTQSLLQEIAWRFDPNETLFVIYGREKLNDLALLDDMFKKHKSECSSPKVEYIHPNQLRGGHGKGSLVCILDGKPQTVSQCILEIHQDELLSLPDSVLDGLLALSVASRCLNPIWTILLGHDKRMLGILRTLTVQELPDEETRRFLKEHIVPTTHLDSIEALEHLVLTQRGLFDTTLVAKPCLLGKGEGMHLEKDFETPELFIEAVANSVKKMMEGTEPRVFPYIIQTYVRQEKFNVLQPPCDDPTLTPVAWNVVATILCLDDLFLGPGIFRSSQKDIVALCNGGIMLAPVLSLPIATPRIRLVANTLREAPVDKVKSLLINDGIALLSLDKVALDPQQLTDFIRDDLGGLIHQHSSSVGSVWTIQPQIDGKARSHTTDPFFPHTDASFEPMPPRFFCLSIVRADKCCGGLLGFASVEEAIKRLSDEDFDVLSNTLIQWRRPFEFSKQDTEDEVIMAPVLMSRRRARIRSDIMNTSHLSESDEKMFWSAYNRFYSHLDKMCHESARLLPERTVILMDNHRYVHARTQIKDIRRSLLRIRFDLSQSPELTSVLAAANAKGLGPGSDRLEDWPVQDKSVYMAVVNSDVNFSYRSQGGLYWSPSGGTTSSTKDVEVCATPSTNRENRAMRLELVDLFCRVGALPRVGSRNCVAVNLFASGGLYRSMEIFTDLFTAVDATNLPLGSCAPDRDVIRCISWFGANIICGWGSRILQLCEAVQTSRSTEALVTVTTIIHGGEKLSSSDRDFIKQVFGSNVKIFGCYGSAEAGVFGVSMEASDSEEKYSILTESIHVEILDDCGHNLGDNEWGNIVVTNTKRKSIQPLIRFNMGDVGRLTGGHGYEKALEIAGRSDRALAWRLNPDSDFLFWDDVEKEALMPLMIMSINAGSICLAQIIVSNNDSITLAVFTSLPQSPSFTEAANVCSVAFSTLVSRLGVTNVKAETLFLSDMSQLIRSSRSQKLMLWVDHRI